VWALCVLTHLLLSPPPKKTTTSTNNNNTNPNLKRPNNPEKPNTHPKKHHQKKGAPCIWQADASNLAIDDVHFVIERARFAAWLADVKKIVRDDLTSASAAGQRGLCLPPGYFWFRFGRTTDDLLSMCVFGCVLLLFHCAGSFFAPVCTRAPPSRVLRVLCARRHPRRGHPHKSKYKIK
jgi:hypothetical protein